MKRRPFHSQKSLNQPSHNQSAIFPLLTRHRENCLYGIPFHLSLKVHPISAAGATNKEQPTNQNEHGYTLLQLYHVISEKNLCFPNLSPSVPKGRKKWLKRSEWPQRPQWQSHRWTPPWLLRVSSVPCSMCHSASCGASVSICRETQWTPVDGWEWRWERAMWKKWWV